MRTWLCLLGVLGLLAACGSDDDGGPRGQRDSGSPGDGDGDGDGGDCPASCSTGFALEGCECVDIDECAGDNDCDDNATCTNTDGGYDCACNDGFVGDGETCTEAGCDDLICDPNATCGDGEGCECAAGFTGDGEGCGDVDECEGSFECADDAACVNTFGGYDCECEPTFGGDGKSSCRPLCEIALEDRDTCAAFGLCRIVDDAAICDACAPGFEGTGKTCTASSDCGDLCDGAGDDDAENAVCAGSDNCECAPGYEGEPAEGCEDINECEEADRCGDNASCINTPGGFFCACEAGYAKNASGACVDKDECEADTSPCHPNATCKNTAGSFECTCKDGYTGDGSICRDENECEEDDACPGVSTCKNTRGSFECACSGKYKGDDPESCYCDLTGTWAMIQDLDTCWEDLHFPGTTGDANRLIAAGAMEATVWELHKMTYDGKVISVEKKGCSTDNAPDLESPFFMETYSSYTPDALFDRLGLFPGVDIEEAGIVPGSTFTTPDEAAVIGIDLGDDPLNATWPAVNDDVNPEGSDELPRWADTDEDGMPGFTVWPRLPTETPKSGVGKYSYLPVTPDGTEIGQRSGCVSVAARVITRLEVEVESCDLLVGNVIDVKSEGRVHACTVIQPEDEMDPITCNPEDWESMDACTSADLDRLDGDQNQVQKSVATFRLERIGDVDDDITCLDVRDQFPPYDHDPPTITCRD